MAPFYYDDDPIGGGYSAGLTPLIIRITMISVLVGSFFQSDSANFATIAGLVLVAVLFEAAARVTGFLGGVMKDRFVTARTFQEETMEYQWIVAFTVERKVFRDYNPHSNRAKGSPQKPCSSSFWWRGSWVQVTHGPTVYTYMPYNQPHQPPKFEIEVTVYSLRTTPISNLLQEAKAIFLGKDCQDMVAVYSFGYDNNGSAGYPSPSPTWNARVHKPVRFMDATSLPVDAMASLVEESAKFWESEAWYNEVGLPFRKGYLLHGPSGSGKRDAVYTVAGKLGRVVYSLSLENGNMNDTFFLKAISTIPKGSIFLLENIQVAFENTDGNPSRLANTCCSTNTGPCYAQGINSFNSLPTTSPFGIIQMLDAITREDGILFFATTNTLTGIDDALFQPGRIDKTINFGFINKERSDMLFKRFFPDNIVNPAPTSYQGYFDDEKYAPSVALAEQFSSQIPENEFTISDMRSYLMSHMSAPEAAVAGVADWVEAQRQEKAKRDEVKVRTKKRGSSRRMRNIPNGDWSPWGGASPIPETMELAGPINVMNADDAGGPSQEVKED